MNTKKQIIIAAVLLILGGGIGYFAKPTKVETKTVEVVKTETKIQKGETKIKYKYKIIKPDGTVIESEKEQEGSYTNSDAVADTSKSSEKVVTNHSGLTIQALASFDTISPEYGVYASKRVFSNIVIGAGVTKYRVLVTAGLEF